jgi:mycothione reductase
MHSDVKTYDVVVIGSGSGQMIVDAALRQGLKVALVEKGALGGTCANVGCIPSKMLITPADRVMEIQEAQKLGIRAEIQAIDFRAIMERMRRLRDEELDEMRESVGRTENLDFYPIEGYFVDDHTLEVGGTRIRGEKVFIVAGARPLIPPVPGLDQVDYLTSDTVFDLEERPDNMIIMGGGYIACELGHFFSAMGTDVTIVGRNERLVPGEEPEISARAPRPPACGGMAADTRSSAATGGPARRPSSRASTSWSPPGAGRTPTCCGWGTPASRRISVVTSKSTSTWRPMCPTSGRSAT